MFLGSMKESQQKDIEILDMKYLVFLAVCEFCYTDNVKFIEDSWAVDLYNAAHMYG